jgi:hypothetical protein
MADLRELETLIATFEAARIAFNAADANDDGAEFEKYYDAEIAVITHPCRSIEDIRLKARFLLDNDGPNDTVQNCFVPESGEPVLNVFLRSLLGEGGAQ